MVRRFKMKPPLRVTKLEGKALQIKGCAPVVHHVGQRPLSVLSRMDFELFRLETVQLTGIRRKTVCLSSSAAIAASDEPGLALK
jgi:hypothetical protein